MCPEGKIRVDKYEDIMLLLYAYVLRTQAAIDNLILPDMYLLASCVLILCKHRSVEARGQPWPSFPSFSTLHFELSDLPRLAGQ